ncbi:MAG: VCBS repeat-containing protein [Deltaproteobacteria bacterium]|nr:VCBS repeat-containing protein [Deltaproteobacteria bacterium]
MVDLHAKKRIHFYLICFICLSTCFFLKCGLARSQQTLVTPDQDIASLFVRHTVSGITAETPADETTDPYPAGFVGAAYVKAGDLDGDGIKEIVCTSGVGQDGNGLSKNVDGALAIFTWDGIDMSNWNQSVIYEEFAFPNEPLIRDMDGDGDLDIMVMDNFIAAWFTGTAAGIYWLDNQGDDISDPDNWILQTIYKGEAPDNPSYHRARFVDIDGDGHEDFITTKVHMWNWQHTDNQYRWVEWWKKETDLTAFPAGYSGPNIIGDGGGFLFNLVDVDADGDLDIIAPQFLIQDAGGMIVKGYPDGSDIRGDSLAWFENPGSGIDANFNGTDDVFELWNRYTIDNWYTSPNPLGKGMETIMADIDNDGVEELIFTSHNHQQYFPEGSGNRIWPSGVYYFDIPAVPEITANWEPITIDASDPALDPVDAVAVANDVFAVDRDTTPSGALSQGSPGMVKAGDFNGDGLTDLVVAGDGKGAHYYYEAQENGDGHLAFSRAALYQDPACMPAEVVIDDIDGDGDLEIIAPVVDTSVAKDLSASSIFIFENTDYTLIDLASFDARPRNGAVRLEWSTASEIDNAGFNLYRAASKNGNYVKINKELVAAKGSPTTGAAYTFIDENAKNGKTFFYMLEDVDTNGIVTMHGPESATARLMYFMK